MAGTYQVVVTNEAKQDINDILDYLLNEVSYQEAVDVRRQIIAAIHSLSERPEARSPVKELAELTKEIIFRQVVVKKAYRLVYRVREIPKNVVVIKVFHVKRGPGFVMGALL